MVVCTYLEAGAQVVGEVSLGSERLTKLGGRYFCQFEVVIVCSFLGADELCAYCGFFKICSNNLMIFIVSGIP